MVTTIEILIKCKNADRYKGINPPKCGGKNPCYTCIIKYIDKTIEELEHVRSLIR